MKAIYSFSEKVKKRAIVFCAVDSHFFFFCILLYFESFQRFRFILVFSFCFVSVVSFQWLCFAVSGFSTCQ